jgi:hypothetical protein
MEEKQNNGSNGELGDGVFFTSFFLGFLTEGSPQKGNHNQLLDG